MKDGRIRINYCDETNIWYAVVDISQLRDNVDIEIRIHRIKSRRNTRNIKTSRRLGI